GRGAVGILGQENVILAAHVRIARSDALIDSHRSGHRVGHSESRFAIADSDQQAVRVVLDRDVVMLEGIELSRCRSHKRGYAEEDQVIQLFGCFNAADNDAVLGELLGAGEESPELVAIAWDEGRKAKERAWIIQLSHA